jgi:hypothetical protein
MAITVKCTEHPDFAGTLFPAHGCASCKLLYELRNGTQTLQNDKDKSRVVGVR